MRWMVVEAVITLSPNSEFISCSFDLSCLRRYYGGMDSFTAMSTEQVFFLSLSYEVVVTLIVF